MLGIVYYLKVLNLGHKKLICPALSSVHETFPTVSWCLTLFVPKAVWPKSCNNLYLEPEKVPKARKCAPGKRPTILIPFYQMCINVRPYQYSLHQCSRRNTVEQTLEWLCYWKLIKNVNAPSWFPPSLNYFRLWWRNKIFLKVYGLPYEFLRVCLFELLSKL